VIRVISLTDAGKALGEKLIKAMDGAVLSHKPKPFSDEIQGYFRKGERLVFICATGIVIRTLAPVITDKYQDPAVLVLDEQGRFVIPLLSGHEGGANDWAVQVANMIGAEPVITTANRYLQPKYFVGMGCERNCPEEELEDLLMDCLEQEGLSIEQISSLSSIDIKADEVGLISLAAKLGLPYLTWDKTQLSSVESKLSTRSEYVFKTVGVYGVAESAALFSAQQMLDAQRRSQADAKENAEESDIAISDTELVMNKKKTTKATCAIARAYFG